MVKRAHLRELLQEAWQASSQEGDRLPFQFALPRLVGLEYRAGTGAETAMIEEDYVLVQQEKVFGVLMR
jgi:hypothetical protein